MSGFLISITWAKWVTFLFAILIALGTLLPAENLPEAPGSDKFHHFVSFALLVIPMCYASPGKWWRYAIYAVLYGAAIELIQPHVNRSGEWLDLRADAIGVAIGVALALMARYVIMRVK